MSSMVPVIGGLAVGIGLVITFSLLSFQEQANDLRINKIVWIAKTAQCDDPWLKEQTSVFNFFENRHIQIHDMDQPDYLEPNQTVCTSCDCNSGWTLSLAVDAPNVPEMQKYGFAVKSYSDYTAEDS